MFRYYDESYCSLKLERFSTGRSASTSIRQWKIPCQSIALTLKCTCFILILVMTNGSQVQILTKTPTKTHLKNEVIQMRAENMDSNSSRSFSNEGQSQSLQTNRYSIIRRDELFYDDDNDDDSDRHKKEINEENKENPPSPPEFSRIPSTNPSLAPTPMPTTTPTATLTTVPTSIPSVRPTIQPSSSPTCKDNDNGNIFGVTSTSEAKVLTYIYEILAQMHLLEMTSYPLWRRKLQACWPLVLLK